MRVMKWSTLAAAVLAISVYAYASPVYADPIGPDNCDSCFGGKFTLQFAPNLATLSTSDFFIFYTVDTSGMNQATFGALDTIGFKVADSLVSASAITVPTGWGTGAPQEQINVGVNNNGCSGGGSGFLCSAGATALTIGPPTNPTYTWEFLVDIGAGNTLFTAFHQATIKATGTSVNGQVVSEGITLQPVPEPTTLLLVGTLLAGVGVWSRKRWLEGNPA